MNNELRLARAVLSAGVTELGQTEPIKVIPPAIAGILHAAEDLLAELDSNTTDSYPALALPTSVRDCAGRLRTEIARAKGE